MDEHDIAAGVLEVFLFQLLNCIFGELDGSCFIPVCDKRSVFYHSIFMDGEDALLEVQITPP